MNFKIGAGRSVIDIPDTFSPAEGFVGIHDALHTRTLLLDNSVNRIALVVIDVTSISSQQVSLAKDIISRAGNVEPANVLVCASHTFSAPHVLPDVALKTENDKHKNEMLQRAIHEAIRHSVVNAREYLQPATVGYGVGTSHVNVNRNILTADGWWHGHNEHGLLGS